MAVPTQAEQEAAVALVEIHDLHAPPVGGDVGPERVERLFDSSQCIVWHYGDFRDSALPDFQPAILAEWEALSDPEPNPCKLIRK